jgi:hypothetical protein
MFFLLYLFFAELRRKEFVFGITLKRKESLGLMSLKDTQCKKSDNKGNRWITMSIFEIKFQILAFF